MSRRERGSSWRLRCACFAAPAEAPRKDHVTDVAPGRVGSRTVGEVVARGLRSLRPPGPRLRPRLGRRGKSVSCLQFPCAGPVPDGPHPTVLPRGSASLSPAGRGVTISVSAAGLLRCGRRIGNSPGGEAAEPESQSWRPEEGQGTSGLCASSPIRQQPSRRDGIWKPGRA